MNKKIKNDVKYPYKIPNCRIWIVELNDDANSEMFKYFTGDKYIKHLLDSPVKSVTGGEHLYDILELITWFQANTKSKIGITVRPNYVSVQFLDEEDLLAFILQYANIIEV